MSQKIVNERRDPRLTDSTPFVRLQYAHQPAASYPESIQLGERSVPTTSTSADTLVAALSHRAARLRILSVRATTEAGSGHPTSCCSAADIVATLFFSVMRFDPRNPKHPNNDRFVLSKGHAAPLLYAAWAEAGAFNPEELFRLRTLDSDLEGHPTPRLNFVDVATGSLGQGLNAGIGLAINAKYLDKSSYRTYVLMGDGESMEGSIWEAAEIARHYQLDNLCAIVTSTVSARATPPFCSTMWRRTACVGVRSAGMPSPWTGTISLNSWTRSPRRPGRKAGPRSSWPARSRARGSRSLKTSRTGTASPWRKVRRPTKLWPNSAPSSCPRRPR